MNTLSAPIPSQAVRVEEIIHQVSQFDSYAEAVLFINEKWSAATQPFVLSFINAHAYNMCYQNAEFCKALSSSDLLLRDGIGMKLLYKTIGRPPGINFNGTDFIPSLLTEMKGKTIALLGTADPYLSNATAILKARGLNVIMQKDGFASLETYVKYVREARPEIVLLGMGMPKQESLALLLKEKVGYPCLVINGGAIIDFLGNKVSRAPQWMRTNGMEWFYRLIIEPRRLFRRYVIGNFVFIYRMFTRHRKSKIAPYRS